MIKLERKNGQYKAIVMDTANLNDRQYQLLHYALQAYAFTCHYLGNNFLISGQQWADEIAKTYDASEPRNAAIINLLTI